MENKNDSLTAANELIAKQDLATRKKSIIAHINAQRNRLQPPQLDSEIDAQMYADIPIVTDSVDATGNETRLDLVAAEQQVLQQRTNPQFDDQGNLIPPDVANVRARKRSRAFPRSVTMKVLTNKKVLFTLLALVGLSVGSKLSKKTNLTAKVKQVAVTVNLNELKKLLASGRGSSLKKLCSPSRCIALAPTAIKVWEIWRTLKSRDQITKN